MFPFSSVLFEAARLLQFLETCEPQLRTGCAPDQDLDRELDQGIPTASPTGLLDRTLLAGLDCLAFLGTAYGCLAGLPMGA